MTLKAQQVEGVATSVANKGPSAAGQRGFIGIASAKGTTDVSVRRALSWAGTVTRGPEALGKRDVCAARRLAMWETFGHLVVVMSLTVSEM